MPDSTRQTVSATQVPALFNASPYLTRWLLWRHFRHGDQIDAEPNERMEWGKRLEPAIFAATCERLSLDGQHHAEQTYVRHATLPIGCTPDGTIHDLNRGPGAVECKNVDWLAWRDGWTEDKAPDHIELQIQTQMLVREQNWGIIACLVGGNELRLYHREPNKKTQDRIAAEVASFLVSVKEGDEPDPMARADEMSLFRSQIDLDAELPPLDKRDDHEAATLLAELRYWTEQETIARTARDARRRALEIMAGDHGEVQAWGHTAYLRRSQTRASEIRLPDDIALGLQDGNPDGIKAALNWSKVTRRGGVQVRIEVKERHEDGEAPWLGDDLEFVP